MVDRYGDSQTEVRFKSRLSMYVTHMEYRKSMGSPRWDDIPGESYGGSELACGVYFGVFQLNDIFRISLCLATTWGDCPSS